MVTRSQYKQSQAQNGPLKSPKKQASKRAPESEPEPKKQQNFSVAKKFLDFSHKNELPRKILHGSIGLMTIGLYLQGNQISDITPKLIAGVVPISLIEVARLNSPYINKLYINTVGSFMRESEKQGQINGVIWYLVGLILVFSFASKDVSFLSVLLLSWADLAASTIGRAFGKYTPQLVHKKSLAGSLAAFVAGYGSCVLIYRVLLVSYPDFNPQGSISYTEMSSKLSVWSLATITGVIASLTELFPVIDDNFSIPVFSAAAISWVISYFKLI